MVYILPLVCLAMVNTLMLLRRAIYMYVFSLVT